MSQQIIQRKVYIFVFAVLMAFLLITIGVAYVNLGPLNPIIAVVIAICKAVLIILYLMHVRYSSRLT